MYQHARRQRELVAFPSNIDSKQVEASKMTFKKFTTNA
ncbi:unnamed protein product [Ectocarpus sp. 6 AP-2014]